MSWLEETPQSSSLELEHPLVILACEDGHELADEDGDAILVESSHRDADVSETPSSANFSLETPTASSWGAETPATANWQEETP